MTISSSMNAAAETNGVKASPSVKCFPTQAPKVPKDTSGIDIIDIRHDAVEINLKDDILASLRPASGPKTLPTLLLYDERGLQLFEGVGSTSQITRCDGAANPS